MTNTHSVDINGTMRADSTTNNDPMIRLHVANGYINENILNQELENAAPFDADQQKDFVYKIHNYCCNPEKLKEKCQRNYQKLTSKKNELRSARKKIRFLKSRVAFLKDVIKTMKQNQNEVQNEPKGL